MMKGILFDMDIGSRIKQLCELNNINSNKLAKILDVNQGLISQVINGKKGMSIPYIEKICSVFNITLSEFFDTDRTIDFEMNKVMNDIKKLDPEELELVKNLIDLLNKKKVDN